MMTSPDHAFWAERLSQYVDGELPGAEARALEAHAADCTLCASALADLRHVLGRIAAAPAASSEGAVIPLWPSIRRQLDVDGPHRHVLTEDRGARLARRALAAGLWLSIGVAGGWWMERAQCQGRLGIPSGWRARMGAVADSTLRAALSIRAARARRASR